MNEPHATPWDDNIDDIYEEEKRLDRENLGICERCHGEPQRVEWIPLHGYSLSLCRKCAASSFRSGEAV